MVLVIISLICALLLTLVPLPESAAPARPCFYAMTVMYWIATRQRLFGLIAAWLCGIVLDIILGTPFSEHGLAMAVAAYPIMKGRHLFWSFSLFQQALFVLPVFAIYEFALFWIDGVAGLAVDPLWRWLPVATSTLLWPFWAFTLERLTNSGVR